MRKIILGDVCLCVKEVYKCTGVTLVNKIIEFSSVNKGSCKHYEGRNLVCFLL